MLNTRPHYLIRRARNLSGEYHPDKFQFRNFGVTWALREHGIWELIVEPFFELYCLDISGNSREYVANKVQKVRDELSYDNALNFQGFWYATDYSPDRTVYSYRFIMSASDRKNPTRAHDDVVKYSGPIPLVYVRMMNKPILEHRTYEEVERLLKEPELRKDDLREM